MHKDVAEMRMRLDACAKYLDAVAAGYRSEDKMNALLDAAMHQMELCCIRMRNVCEQLRPNVPKSENSGRLYYHREVYGSVTLLDTGWLQITMDALLPHCKVVGGTQYVKDTITRLLDHFCREGGVLPQYEKAFLSIVEYCPKDASGVFDQDNKGFKGVINALKGRVFPDDNQFELSLGLFTVEDPVCRCEVTILPLDEASDFLYRHCSEHV